MGQNVILGNIYNTRKFGGPPLSSTCSDLGSKFILGKANFSLIVCPRVRKLWKVLKKLVYSPNAQQKK